MLSCEDTTRTMTYYHPLGTPRQPLRLGSPHDSALVCGSINLNGAQGRAVVRLSMFFNFYLFLFLFEFFTKVMFINFSFTFFLRRI